MQDKVVKEEKGRLIKLSASSVKTYESCNRKYYYTYIEKLPKKTWAHLDLGTFCHAVLEQFHKEWPLDKNITLSSLIGKCFSEQRNNYKLSFEQLEDTKNMLQEYLFYVEKNGMPNVLAVEEPFEIIIDKYIIRGFIDRIDIDKDAMFHIVDYKTTKNAKYLDDFQLLVYGLALKNRYPEIDRFRGSYVLLKNSSRYLTTEFNLHDIKKCEKKILEFGERIEQEQKWEKRPGPLCNYCDFYEPCMVGSWIKEETSE